MKKRQKEKISLEERFAKYNGKNLAKEFSWDDQNEMKQYEKEVTMEMPKYH